MDFVGNLFLFQAVEEFWKSVKIWQSYRHEFGVLLFWGLGDYGRFLYRFVSYGHTSLSWGKPLRIFRAIFARFMAYRVVWINSTNSPLFTHNARAQIRRTDGRTDGNAISIVASLLTAIRVNLK